MAYAGIEAHLWLVEFSNIPLSLGSGKCGSPDQPSIPLPLLSDIDIGSARRSISPSGSQHQRHTLIDDEFSGRVCRFRESSNKFGLLAIKPVKHSRLYQTLIALVRDRTAALQRMGRESQASLGAAQMASPILRRRCQQTICARRSRCWSKTIAALPQRNSSTSLATRSSTALEGLDALR
jgi:hypothetical protein